MSKSFYSDRCVLRQAYSTSSTHLWYIRQHWVIFFALYKRFNFDIFYEQFVSYIFVTVLWGYGIYVRFSDYRVLYAFYLHSIIHKHPNKRILTVGGSITVRQVSSFTSIHSTASLHTNNSYKSSLVKLETSCAVILPPTMCVLCPYSIRIIDQYVLLTLKSFQFLAIYLLFISSFRDALN